jgi:hypothetical protein
MNLEYRGELIEVDVKQYGEYTPATRWQPEEYPDYELRAVYYKDVDIINILSETDIDEIMEIFLNEL